MNALPLLSDASGAGRGWGAGKVKTSRNQGNPISPASGPRAWPLFPRRKAAGRTFDSVSSPKLLRVPPTFLEAAYGAVSESNGRPAARTHAHEARLTSLELEFESPRHNEAFSAVLLALMVAGLLVFALT